MMKAVAKNRKMEKPGKEKDSKLNYGSETKSNS